MPVPFRERGKQKSNDARTLAAPYCHSPRPLPCPLPSALPCPRPSALCPLPSALCLPRGPPSPGLALRTGLQKAKGNDSVITRTRHTANETLWGGEERCGAVRVLVLGVRGALRGRCGGAAGALGLLALVVKANK